MKSILDPTFRYTSSVHTDLRKTFARARREQRVASAAEVEAKQEVEEKVLPMVRKVRTKPAI